MQEGSGIVGTVGLGGLQSTNSSQKSGVIEPLLSTSRENPQRGQTYSSAVPRCLMSLC